jgi:hypothetical protein
MRREGRTTSVSDLVSHLDDIVQILRLADLDRRFTPDVDGLERGQIGATLVDGYRLGHPVASDRLLEIPLRRSLVALGAKQEVHRVAGLVDGAVKILI